MPQLPQTTKNIWTVKSTSQISKPRFVIVTLQTNANVVEEVSSQYDNCNISDIKLYLNSECYPYDNLNLDFTNRSIQELFHSYIDVQKSYYNGREGDNPVGMTYELFTTIPLFTFDCSRSDDSLLGGTVDIRLEINARANIPANTAANCLIIYDNYFEYSPFSSIVVKKT